MTQNNVLSGTMDTKFLMSLLFQVNKNQEYIHKGFKKTISVWVSHNRYQKITQSIPTLTLVVINNKTCRDYNINLDFVTCSVFHFLKALKSPRSAC